MAKPTRVTATIREASGDLEVTTMSFYLGSSINTISSIELAAKSVLEALQACITGDVIAVSFSFPIDITGWTLAAAAGADTDRLVGGRIIMASADPYYAQINLPTFDLDKLGTGKDIDMSDADLVTLEAAMQGTTLTTSQDNEVNTVASAYRTYGGKK